MSTALGIASVTHVLKDLLNDGFINHNVANALGTVVNVSSKTPGQLEEDNGTPSTQLNIFMYRVTPNTGWMNTGYPSRNGDGEIINNPPLALNLHYILTAFGKDELHSEILLGYAMQILHENPFLDRDKINTSLSGSTAEDPEGSLPANLLALAGSQLAEQIEQIKIVPENISLDDMSKLWTAFQIKYRLCTAYQATVVLIESNKSTLSPLPVLTRTIYTVPFKQPDLEKILSQTGPAAPIRSNQRIASGHIIVIRGKQLKRDSIAVLLNGEPFTPLPADVSDTEVRIEVPATLKAGVVGVQIAHFIKMDTPPENRKGATSNLLAFVLSPSIENFSLTDVTTDSGIVTSANFSVDVTPGVFRRQRIILLFNELNPSPGEDPESYSFNLPDSFLAEEENAVTTIVFPIYNVKTGDYLVRIQVDGAESPLIPNGTGEFDTPQFNIS